MRAFETNAPKSQRIAVIRENVSESAVWALKALATIYANQTADEQRSQETRDHNGVGFTGADANLLSSFAEQYAKRGSLSPKQMKILHEKMPKYAKQLNEAALALGH